MTSDRTQRNIRRAAELIAQADALLITAGAGMGVDSGLPDFRGKEGFWRAYPALGKRGISFEEMAQPQWFFEDPAMAWAFYGHRQRLYRETKPHVGYTMLRDWARAMPAGYFVVTSNVDGHFDEAEFAPNRILELHGDIHRYQCAKPCSQTLWQDKPPDLSIDLETLRASGKLPHCPECGGMARPNVMMFGDTAWVPDAVREQRERYADWLASVRGRRVVILELGAGKAIPSIRRLGEDLATRDVATLVRINPDATDADEPAVPVRMTALEALRRIEAASSEGFKERCRVAAVPVPDLRSREEISRRIDEHFKKNPGAIASTQAWDHLELIKWRKTYSKAWQITMPSGYVAWVDRLDVERNYLGMISGLAGTPYVNGAIRRAQEFVRANYGGPEPVVIPPTVFDATSDYGVLPPLRFVAQISSGEPIADDDHGSWMNLIWFAEIDDEKSIKAFVEEALAQVDWKRQAEGYSI